MYHIAKEDDFQPRVTPKPISKLDGYAVPSVPEVSLIFDKPLRYKTVEKQSSQESYKHSSPVGTKNTYSPQLKSSELGSKGSTYRNSTSPSFNCDGSYAAWREQNFAWKPTVSNMDSKTPETRRTQNYSPQSMPVEYKSNTYALQNNSDKFQDKQYVKQSTRHQHNSRKIDPRHSNSNKPIPCQDEYSLISTERKLPSPEQKKMFSAPITKGIHNLNANPNTFNKAEFQAPHLGYQYPYIDMNTYPFPQLYCSNHNNSNEETIKNLLQLVNNQSEQIKCLQTQVDRLLKMQEESFKDKQKCTCSQLQNEMYIDSCDTMGTSNCFPIPQNNSKRKNMYQSTSIREPDKENLNDKNASSELMLSEQSKKAFVEQKVSIGVMTSFEFTVQNSPFEDYDKKTLQTSDNLKITNGINLSDPSESIRRYKNSFTRMPSAQLENIVEDSESYLSSQQQSSNLNASVSTKDLEKQTQVEIQKESDNYRSESPRAFERRLKHATDALRQDRNSRETRHCNTRSPLVENHTEHNVQDTNCNESPKIIDDCKNYNTGRRNDSKNSKNSPIDYSKTPQWNFKQGNRVEDSLILSGVDLRVNERPPPTPEPSIHVEMNEYSSDDDSEKVKRTSKVGWTFYNNVLGQVNQILQNSCVIDDQEVQKTNQNNVEDENRVDTVKVTTLEQLRKLGISLSENSESKEANANRKSSFDSSFYPRLDPQANMTHTTSAVNETNTSMHMKALALKYLSDEQLAELALQGQGATSLKHLMLSNVQGTNMSFATMRYLERYQLLPGKNNLQTEDNTCANVEVPTKPDLKFTNPKTNPTLQRFQFNQTPRTTCPSKILDISTLKQQPKLL